MPVHAWPAAAALRYAGNELSENDSSVTMHDEEDFAALFAASQQAKRLAIGETVEGTIVAIGPEVALVDVGAKGEASLAVD